MFKLKVNGTIIMLRPINQYKNLKGRLVWYKNCLCKVVGYLRTRQSNIKTQWVKRDLNKGV